jgi:hypothetical protein
MADAASENSGVHLWLVLMKAHRALSRHAIKSIEPSGLGQSDFAVLEHSMWPPARRSQRS